MKQPEINLNGWQTIKAASLKWGVSTNVISNWITRNKLQSITYPELNNLRLVPADKPESLNSCASVWLDSSVGVTLNENGTVAEVADQSTKPKRRKP